ncbi:MAG: DUF6766 family protein [Novosphingobium sp.]
MRFLRDNGLTIALLLMFLCSIIGQWLAGWHVAVQDALRHGDTPIGLGAYTVSPRFLSSVFENWESEFLQMSTYVVLTAFLFQRGSAESRDPDAPPRDDLLELQAHKPGAPAILRWGRLWRVIYSHSLGLALFVLFLVSFVIHWTQSAQAAAQDAIEHGEPAQGVFDYLGDAQLWFESFQNWQSEFLSTAALVVLSIWLRQHDTPESKPVAAPHGQTGA